jgi:signal transduction histidine kinase
VRSRQLGGTGLGLAIAKTTIEAHGGHIEAESHLGEGTKISLPLLSQPQATEDKPESASLPENR